MMGLGLAHRGCLVNGSPRRRQGGAAHFAGQTGGDGPRTTRNTRTQIQIR
jgi:hypothetical protein